MKKFAAGILAGALVLSLVCGAFATELNQSPYEKHETSWKPAGTVSLIIPAGAGGNTDISARLFAQYAHEKTGADFIVVNVNGAGGTIASRQVLSAKPDGLTVLYGHALVNVANIAGMVDYNYTAFKLGPTFAKDPAQQLYVAKGKYADCADFIAKAKENPATLVAATEVGAYTYYEILAFQKLAGIELDIQDKGSNSEKIVAMLSGTVDVMPGAFVNTKSYVEDDKFTCLGAPTAERYDLIKDFPTFKEQGVDLVYPDCDFSFYFPKETPDEVITYFENLVQDILTDEKAKADLETKAVMMPYYLNAADSEKNEEWMFNTINTIAESVEEE